MEEEEEEEVRLGDYAGLVAKAVLAETMAERIWSIPCSADCHRTHNTTTTGADGRSPRGGGGAALCWTPESSCTNLQQQTPEFQAHCSQYTDREKPGQLLRPASPPTAPPGTPSPPRLSASPTPNGQPCSEAMVTGPRASLSSADTRTETDVVHYRLSGHSRDSLHLPERWPGPREKAKEQEEEEDTRQPAHAQSLRNKSVENLSSTPDLLINGNKPSVMRKGLSVNDITRVSSSEYHQAGVNGVAQGAAATHKSPSRLQFLRHLGIRRNVCRDEVTVRTGVTTPTDSSEDMDRGGPRKCGGGSSNSSISLRKTITNIFHLKPPSRNYSGSQACVTEETSESRRKACGARCNGGGLMSRLTAKRHKTVPPGKRALPPVPPPPAASQATSRTPSPQQQLTPIAADRVPSPADVSLEAVDWSEGGGGGGAWPPALDRSPELAQPGGGGVMPAASPSAVQSQMDFAASIEKVKDHGWYWGPLSGEAAERILAKEPDGSFVVRDSSDHHYIFSLTFKLNGFVRHVRIEHDQGNFSFGSFTKFKSNTIVDFIENAVEHSRSGRYLFFLHRRPVLGPMRVQLLHPVSRFKRVQSLQHLCRYVIVKHVRKDHLEELPVPNRIKTYLNTPFYYSEQIEAEAENDPSMLSLDTTEPPVNDWHTNLPEVSSSSATSEPPFLFDVNQQPPEAVHPGGEAVNIGGEAVHLGGEAVHNNGEAGDVFVSLRQTRGEDDFSPPTTRVPNGRVVEDHQQQQDQS